MKRRLSRALVALLAAIAAATATLTVVLSLLAVDEHMGLGAAIVLYVFAGVLVHGVLFGLPLAIVGTRRGWNLALAAPVAGFAIGAVPLGLLLGFAIGVGSTNDWIAAGEWAGIAGFAGATGGAVFWLVWRRRGT